jgi:hypothetical protein
VAFEKLWRFGNRLIWKWVTCREHFDSKSKD